MKCWIASQVSVGSYQSIFQHLMRGEKQERRWFFLLLRFKICRMTSMRKRNQAKKKEKPALQHATIENDVLRTRASNECRLLSSKINSRLQPVVFYSITRIIISQQQSKTNTFECMNTSHVIVDIIYIIQVNMSLSMSLLFFSLRCI